MSAFLSIDPSSPVPVFRQVAERLRAAISSGAIPAGEPLPGIRGLAEDLGVNPNTVQKAVASLEREGLVRAERGIGMIVQGGTRGQARSASEEEVRLRLEEAMRLAHAAGLSDERVEQLLRRARRARDSNKGGAP